MVARLVYWQYLFLFGFGPTSMVPPSDDVQFRCSIKFYIVVISRIEYHNHFYELLHLPTETSKYEIWFLWLLQKSNCDKKIERCTSTQFCYISWFQCEYISLGRGFARPNNADKLVEHNTYKKCKYLIGRVKHNRTEPIGCRHSTRFDDIFSNSVHAYRKG